jgi:hypothetical protein
MAIRVPTTFAFLFKDGWNDEPGETISCWSEFSR